METQDPVRIGISSCLTGCRVRYDGRHRRDPLLMSLLGPHVEWVPTCPEVEVGMGTPREPLHLVGEPDAPRLETTATRHDWSAAMHAFATQRATELAALPIHGYIFKRGSPSCGMKAVPVFAWPPAEETGTGTPVRLVGQFRGLFADVLMRSLPLLPVEEEGRLEDAGLRDNFVERVLAYREWLAFVSAGPDVADVVKFHTRHKMALLAHGRPYYQRLGQMVARAGGVERHALVDAYGAGFMAALQFRATRGRHADVLTHLLGFLKRAIDPSDRDEILTAIEDFRIGRLPWIIPATLLRHHFCQHPDPWVAEQTYLAPEPLELALRAER